MVFVVLRRQEMRNRIEAYIPNAIAAITTLGIANGDNIVPKQFNGYIASFGASVRQAGLLATVLFYGNTNANSEQARDKVVSAIEIILGQSIVENGVVIAERDKVEDAAVALKLAVRTFRFSEE